MVLLRLKNYNTNPITGYPNNYMEVDIIGIFYGAMSTYFNHIKFMTIVLLFLITAFYNKKIISKRDISLLQLGMFFTVLADFHLIMLRNNTSGVGLFCVVQIIYIARYDLVKFELTMKRLSIILIIIIFTFLFLIYLNKSIDFIIPISVFYSICLCTSLYKSVKAMKYDNYPYPNKYLIAWGMVLFLLCDINVALSYTKISYDITSKLIWIFYFPSQLLLSISGYHM